MTARARTHRPRSASTRTPPEGLVLGCLLLGLALLAARLAGDYGITIDDPGLWAYGKHVVLLYQEALHGQFSFDPGPENLRFYGPAFLTLASLAEKVLVALQPAWERVAAWHFSIFVSFLAGIPALYAIARRLFALRPAAALTLLYTSQPLLWGHAFINGKDIPFLSAFLISVAAGLRLSEQVPAAGARRQPPRSAGAAPLAQDLGQWPAALKTRMGLALASLGTLSVLLRSFPQWSLPAVRGLLTQAATQGETWLGRWFAALAEHSTTLPLESYINKGVALVQAASGGLLALAWLSLLLSVLRALPRSRQALLYAVRQLPWRASVQALKAPAFWLASLALGVTFAIRVVGPFAGVLVAGYVLAHKGRRALPLLLLYAGVACLAGYLLWPYLWPAPLAHLIGSLRTMTDFPQENLQLLNGQFFSGSALPWYFVPELLLLQLSLPTWLLLAAGLWQAFRRQPSDARLRTLLALWAGLPLLYCVVFTPTMYNNFRQWLFILPPLFIFCGFAFEALARRPWAFAGALLIVLAVHVSSLVRLHPYQYVYYNEWVGGVSGAAGRFEMDYWGTAMQPAMQQLNTFAPPQSRVVVWSASSETASTAARPDLLVEGEQGGTYDLESGYHYAIIQLGSTRSLYSPYPAAPVVASVDLLGVPLAIVKQIIPNGAQP